MFKRLSACKKQAYTIITALVGQTSINFRSHGRVFREEDSYWKLPGQRADSWPGPGFRWRMFACGLWKVVWKAHDTKNNEFFALDNVLKNNAVLLTQMSETGIKVELNLSGVI